MTAAKSKKSRGASKKPRKVRPMQKRKKEVELKLFAYDLEHLGICVGISLNREGDVLVLYEAGRFCAWLKNLSGVRRRALSTTFLGFINHEFECARALHEIRSVLGRDNEADKVQARQERKKLFAR